MQRILLFILFIVCVCSYASCQDEGKERQAEALTGSEIPSMVTHDAVMLISDSGVIKYRAIADNWTRYSDEAKEPYQYFPEGIRFEQIDSTRSAQQTIIADTAYNWENQQVWHLIGNVEVTSIKGELFQTEELYWNMRDHTVYSDSFIHIERTENIIEGYGFNSNDSFTQYEIRRTSGVFPAKEQPVKKDTITTDSITTTNEQ